MDIYKEISGPEPMWTIDQFAKYMSINRVTVYRWIKNGDLKPIRIGNRLRVPMSEVKRMTGEVKNSLKVT